MRADMGTMNIKDPAEFINKLVVTEEAIAEYTRGAPLHTDDNARLEYSAPKALLEVRSTLLLEELYRYRSKPADMLRSLRWVEIDTQMEKDLSAMFRGKKEVLDGFISSAKGMAQDAIQKCEDALALNPADYDATYLLAKLNYEIASRLKNARQPSEAMKAYLKSIDAIDKFIGGERTLLSDHFALEVIYARANLDLGVMALKANRLKQATAALQESVSGEVRFAEAHNNLGVAYARLGKDDAAVNHYQRAIELNPNLVSAHMNMGNTRLKQKRYKGAIESYRQVEKLRPDFAITNYNLGLAYFKQNQWARAEKEWMRALALKPDFAQAQKTLNGLRNRMK